MQSTHFRTLSRTTLSLVALLALPAIGVAQATPARGAGPAAPAASLTGAWIFTVTTEAGGGTPTVTLTQKGDSISGHYSSETFGEQDVKGTVTNRDFTFQFTASAAGQSLNVVYKGTIESADALKGSVTFAGLGGGTFTAKKKPAP